MFGIYSETVAIMLHFAEVPCTKTMKDGGVIKKKELHVEGKDTTTLKVTIPSATSDKHEPQWVSVTLTVENVKEVKVTPNDKSGKPTDSPKTTEVSQTATTVEVKFETSPHADHLTVELTKKDDSKPVKSDVTSAKACLPKNGELKMGIKY